MVFSPQDAQSQHASQLYPAAFSFLRSSHVKLQPRSEQRTARRLNLWRHVQSYAKSAYSERTLMLDPALAGEVADAIAQRSERGPATSVFMDADGGCCDVTRRLLERGVFPRAQVLVRDKRLRGLHEWALKESLYHVAER